MRDSSWKLLLRDFEKSEAQREKIVQLSREVIQCSKKSIYAAHRHDLQESKTWIDNSRTLIKKILLLKKKASADSQGSVRVALQEYVEAICLYNVIQGKDIPSHKALGVDSESYLLGLCDLVGELGRFGVHRIINNDYQTTVRMQKIVHNLYGKFMHLNLRNNELRKKVDGVKWELKKIEDVILQLKIAGRL
ncbi:MAG: hypothetical protein AABX51_05325 [Nanoarchaeota archaeon]